MTAMLELTNVTKSFGGVLANDGVSLKVEEGMIVGLIGPNGSGKTTLFNAITGAFPIDGGSIEFEGEEISTLLAGAVARRGIVRTFQQPRIFPAHERAGQHAGLRRGQNRILRRTVPQVA
ncbi:MAG TPA: ATP-binding cassette domain-containing protein [Methyloceanibacter sp.]